MGLFFERKEKTGNLRSREDKLKIFQCYIEETEGISNEYYKLLHEIEKEWSAIYNSKEYEETVCGDFEMKCINCISLYKKMCEIDRKYREKTPDNCPAYKRLAMLYEKQQKYNESIEICVDALKIGAYGDGMCYRLDRMIKKAKRKPTLEEQALIDKYTELHEKYAHELSKKTSANTQSSRIDRKQIPSKKIEEMQRIEASGHYRNKVYRMFYKGYNEKPFISQDRELNTDWIEQAKTFPGHCIIPKSIMKRYSDGLLQGHVYQLYWIKKYNCKRRIPSYFEYKYGIDFVKEKGFLMANGYLSNDGTITQKGIDAIKTHNEVIENH